MGILFRADRHFSNFDVQNLLASVGWFSAEYPEQLRKSLQTTGVCITAWDGGLLVGLCSALTDGYMTAYINYLAVLPEYQHRGIGTHLTRITLSRLEGYRRIILLAEPNAEPFYQRFGFQPDEHARGMALIQR